MSATTAVQGGERSGFPTVEEFENGTLDADAFNHQAHVFMAWKLLGRYPLTEAAMRYTGALKRLTRKLGAEAKYHETISWFYMALIAERCAVAGNASWEIFITSNPDLLQPGTVLSGHYSEFRLNSDLARRQFLLPDRCVSESVAK